MDTSPSVVTPRISGGAAPIASATSVAQVTELMGALELTLTAADVAELDKASA